MHANLLGVTLAGHVLAISRKTAARLMKDAARRHIGPQAARAYLPTTLEEKGGDRWRQ